MYRLLGITRTTVTQRPRIDREEVRIVSSRQIDEMLHLECHGQCQCDEHHAYNVLTDDEHLAEQHLASETEIAFDYRNKKSAYSKIPRILTK